MRIIITTIGLALTLTLSAQTKQAYEKTALEEITADKFLAGGNAVDYDRLPRQALTPTPKGYEPFYISHYGRHGARWLLSDRDYSAPITTLTDAKKAGVLTAVGEQTLAKLEEIRYKAIPTACNVQLIFYRPKKSLKSKRTASLNSQHSTLNSQTASLNSQHSTLNSQPASLNSQHSTLNSQTASLNSQTSTLNSDDVLVKALLNENEVTMPVETDMFPYYKWSDVRKYYLEKLKKQPKNPFPNMPQQTPQMPAFLQQMMNGGQN